MAISFQDLLDRKIRLEFGNLEQINAIDAEIQRHEEERQAKEAEEKGEGLKKVWEVELMLSGSFEVEVVAIDEEEAIEKARDEYYLNHSEADIDIEMEDARPIRIATEDDD